MKRIYFLLTIALLYGVGIFASSIHAAGNAEAGKEKATPCVACHGVGGVSVNPAWPNLAGQGEKYFINQLQLFKDKVRVNVLMNSQAENLSEQDMQDLAAYYAGLEPAKGSANPDKEFEGEKLYTIGERIYRGGNAETGVPACMSCHAPDGSGNGPAKFPQLAGQHAAYTVAQLKAYRSGDRYQPDDNLNMMKDIAGSLSDVEMDAVAEYIAGLH